MKKVLIMLTALVFAACAPEKPKTAEEKRDELVRSQFSGYDGSHAGLEKLIKDNMNDPDSYEHVETRFKDEGKYILVATKYRGKNAFGGVVTGYVTANVDFNGKVIKVISQE